MKRILSREFFLLLALIALSAGWATHLGTLPGQGRPVLGPLVEGLLWASLHAGLSLAYLAAGPVTQEPGRVPRVIGLCLLLALLSAHLCNLLSAALSTSWMWGKLFYLKRLVPPAWVVFWCVALLPRETRALVGTLRATPTIAPVPHLAVLLASASILVSCADLAFEWSGDSAVQSALKHQIITKEAWAGNVLVLFSAYALAFAVTSRVLAALLLVSPLYAALGLASVAKIHYMHSAVQPLDVVRIGEFVPLIRSFFGTVALVVAVGALGLWIGALVVAGKLQPAPVSMARRRATGLLSLAVLVAVPAAYFVEPAPWLWRDTGKVRSPGQELVLAFSRALLGRDRDRQFRETAREAGFLRSFLSELPAAFVPTPANYSPEVVAGSAGRYCTRGSGTERLARPAARGHGGVNLILYLVESLMDPADLGWRYTSDPIPNMRALREDHIGGHAIVPEEFGGSPTTEFEALTGMTTAFLPEGSVAYRLYLKHPIPSLPSTLGSLGYTTTAIRADPKYFYNHETAYRLLGFDKVVYLDESPVVDRGPRGTWPSDDAVVDAVLQAAGEAQPFFVLAFASSAHSPYNHGTYEDSDLDVRDAPTADVAGDVKEYINALRAADRAIGRLVERLRDEPDSTILVVLGDHLPPLPDGPLQRFFVRLSGMSAPEGAWMRRRVPLLVWANFELPREEKELSTNGLPSYLLEKMGIPSAGFLRVSDAVSRRVSIVRSYAKAANGTIWHWDSLPVAERRLVEDYRLLQYDVLLGKRYSLSGSVAVGRPCGSTLTPQPVSRP